MTNSHNRHWTAWLGKLALTLSLAAIVVALVGTTLARFDAIEKMTGFMGFVYALRSAMWLAGFAALALVLSWVLGKRTSWSALVGLLAAGALMATGAWLRGEAGKYPAIHDATTDLESPPAFTALEIPEDNLRGVESKADWRELHREGYPDLAPVEVPSSVADTIARAEELAEERGWTVIASDAEAGRLEAVAYAGWIKFEDIVVLTAEPNESGGSTVNMRSISRVGVSDLGYNAKRIREFLAALEAG